jgi:CRISPR-associated protein Cas1
VIKRTLLFSTPCYLGVKNHQIRFSPKDPDKEERIIPLEDVGFVILENPAITLSVQLLERLNENGAAVIVCDGSHMPSAMLQSFAGNQTHAETLRAQIESSLPLKKGLWKSVVIRKIKNQAAVLKQRGHSGGHSSLSRLAGEVKSDDADNREGAAARKYWESLFSIQEFVRDRDGDSPNHLLNYGYAILRAATARALVSSGLYCAMGIHHRNRYNPFALADDLMEPYRPFIDHTVCALMDSGKELKELTPAIKQELLQVMTTDTSIRGQRSPLLVALSSSTASLARSFIEKENKLVLPEWP